MKRFAGLSLGAALSMAVLVPAPGQAAPFGGVAASSEGSLAPLVQVQAGPRHRGRVGVPRSGGRVYHGRRGGGVAAGALIGAAILGGAIIANSQRNSSYYYDDGYYAPNPYYGPGYVPVQYYRGGYYYSEPAPRRTWENGSSDPAPGYYYGVPAPRRTWENGSADPYYPAYRHYPRHRTRGMRDPAGGGTLR
ncbi:MAG TPA: hypothetical protein PKW21_02775 [Rhabdaerophilum sp.]|nr:hypothetical protein [Rhabdaerophilum sp.]